MKKFFALLIVFLVTFSLVGCSDKNELIGTWQSSDYGPVIFTEDTFTIYNVTVNYELDGSTIILSDNEGETSRLEYKISGNTLTLDGDGEVVDFERIEWWEWLDEEEHFIKPYSDTN